jgi:hypothetical protein
MTDEKLKQAIELDGKRSRHQFQIECIEHFDNSVHEPDMEDPWDDIDIVFSGPNDSCTLGNIPNQLKTDILAMVKNYHRDQINNINEQIQEL